MGKNIKSYATFPQSIPPRKGREALRQKVQIFRLKYGTVLPYTFVSKFTSKIFQLRFVLWQISSELPKFCAVRQHSPQITQNSHHLLTHYIVCFRCLTSGRELPKIPANQAKFAQFAHGFRELRKFHAFCTKIHPHLVN